MKLPVIRESYFLNITILLFSLFVSWFCLLFGIAHLVEGRDPNIPNSENMIVVMICIGLCIIGVIFLWIAYASAKGILFKIIEKNKTE